MRILSLTTFLVISIWLSAQIPQGIKYQAVARSSQGQVVTSQIIGLEIAILQGGPNGQVTYTETHRPTTNEFGLFTIVIGEGTAILGTFSNIDWSLGEYFVRTSLDINGGNNYAFMGTSQLLSVPYALYAERTSKSDNDFDQDSTNELQTLDLTGTTLSISNGNSVQLGGTVDLDGDPTNEIQQLSLNGTQLNLSNGGGSVALPSDNDGDPSNEIQTISSSATGTDRTITLSQSNATTIDVADDDNDASNELQDLSSTKAGNEVTIDISNGVGTTINVDDADADPENELQQLQLSGDTISLSQNGGSIVMPSDMPSGGCIISIDTTLIPGYSYTGIQMNSGKQYVLEKVSTIPDPTIGALTRGLLKIGDNILVIRNSNSYIFNPLQKSWSNYNNPIPNLETINILLSNMNNSYIFSSPNLHIFDSTTHSFIPITNTPNMFPVCACNYKDSIIYLSYTLNQQAAFTDIHIYNPSTNLFVKKISFPFQQVILNGSCVTVGDSLYLFGLVFLGSQNTMNELFIYDFNSNLWSVKSSWYPTEYLSNTSGATILKYRVPDTELYNNKIFIANFVKSINKTDIMSTIGVWDLDLNYWETATIYFNENNSNTLSEARLINVGNKIFFFDGLNVYEYSEAPKTYLHCKN